MTEGKKKTLLKLGIILVAVTVACLVMVGTGAASLDDQEITYDIKLSYYEPSGLVEDKELNYPDMLSFFGAEHVYYLEKPEDLIELAELTSQSHLLDENYDKWRTSAYILKNDIDCSAYENMPSIAMVNKSSISAYFASDKFFTGSIWGNGHTIMNFRQEGEEACGLIAHAGKNWGYSSRGKLTINNLTMENCYIYNTGSNDGVGAFVGRIDHSSPSCWKIDDNVPLTMWGSRNACLIGCNLINSTILSKDKYVGGLVGQSYDTGLFILNCSVKQCKIFSTHNHVGGMVGGADNGGLVKIVTFGVQYLIPFKYGGFLFNLISIPGFGTVWFADDVIDTCKIGGYNSKGIFGGAKNIGGAMGYAYGVGLLGDDTLPQGVVVNNCLIETNTGNAGGLLGHAETLSGGKSYNGKELSDPDYENYYSVTNTAVLSDDTWDGVVVGDPNYPINFITTVEYYIASVDSPNQNRLQAKNTIVGGKWFVIPHCPGFDGISLTNAELTNSTFYVQDTYPETWIKDITLKAKNEEGETLATYYKDFNTERMRSEYYGGYGTISTVEYDGRNIVDLGTYGTWEGYGYVSDSSEQNMYPVTFITITTSYDPETGEVIQEEDSVTYNDRFGAHLSKPADSIFDGFIFDGWYKDENTRTDKWNFTTDKLTGPLELYAHNDEIYYNINFYDTLYDEDPIDSFTGVYYSRDVELPEDTGEPHSGYKFTGWNTEKDGTGVSYAGSQVVSGLTTEKEKTVNLYSQWFKTENHVLTFVMNGHGTQIKPVESDDYGSFEKYKDIAPEADHYAFGGWFTDESCQEGTEFNFEEKYTTNQTVYAKWTEYTYSIGFDANGGIGFMEDITDVPYSRYITLPSNEFSCYGYYFAGWKLNDKIYSDEELVTGLGEVDGEKITMVAQWNPKVVTLTCIDTTGVSDYRAEITSDDRGYFVVTDVPVASGYIFEGWYTEDGQKYDFTQSYTENQTAYARWAENTYTIKFHGNGSTGGSMNDQTVRYSWKGPLDSNSYYKENYVFIGWSTKEDGTGTFYADKDIISMLSPVSGAVIDLYAQWDYDKDAIIYLNFSMDGHGSQMQRVEYHSGDEFKTPESPTSPGVRFTGWYTDETYSELFIFEGKIRDQSATAFAKWEEVPGVYVWDGSGYVNAEDLEESLLASTVSYDKENHVLNLDGYSADFTAFPDDNYGAIYSTLEEELTINLVNGSENVIGSTSIADNTGITSMYESISFTGDGKLTIYADANKDTIFVCAISSPKDINIEAGTLLIYLNTKGTTGIEMVGVSSGEKVHITDGFVAVNVVDSDSNSIGISGIEEVSVLKGDVLVSGAGVGISSENTVAVSGGYVSLDACDEGIRTRDTYRMEGGEVTITNASTGVYFSSRMDFSNMTSGYLEISVSDRSLAAGREITLADNMKVYIGESPETKELWTGTDTDDLLNVKEDYMLFIIDTSSNGRSSITSFIGEKDGNEFTFERAVVITKMTLPGASYATVENTSGSRWYNCMLNTDGTAGIAYFQVPLDVIDIKGYTVNDVSLIGSVTTYLGTDGQYAKYSAPVTGGGAYTIDFEKDAATSAVEKVQEAVEQKQTATEQKQEAAEKVQEVVEQKQTTQTAAKTPFPVLGILAGLGIAGLLALRRK